MKLRFEGLSRSMMGFNILRVWISVNLKSTLFRIPSIDHQNHSTVTVINQPNIQYCTVHTTKLSKGVSLTQVHFFYNLSLVLVYVYLS